MTDHGLELERPYRERDPLDMDDAREASRRVARLRRDAEAQLIRGVKDRATKEGDYRETLAKQIVVQKADHGSTVAKELAHDNADVKKALVEFKIAEGMVDAYKERVRGVEGERSMLKSLIDWSSTIANVLRQAGGIKHEERDEDRKESWSQGNR